MIMCSYTYACMHDQDILHAHDPPGPFDICFKICMFWRCKIVVYIQLTSNILFNGRFTFLTKHL